MEEKIYKNIWKLLEDLKKWCRENKEEIHHEANVFGSGDRCVKFETSKMMWKIEILDLKNSINEEGSSHTDAVRKLLKTLEGRKLLVKSFSHSEKGIEMDVKTNDEKIPSHFKTVSNCASCFHLKEKFVYDKMFNRKIWEGDCIKFGFYFDTSMDVDTQVCDDFKHKKTR